MPNSQTPAKFQPSPLHLSASISAFPTLQSQSLSLSLSLSLRLFISLSSFVYLSLAADRLPPMIAMTQKAESGPAAMESQQSRGSNRKERKQVAVSIGGGGGFGGVVVWGGALAAATLISAFAISRRLTKKNDQMHSDQSKKLEKTVLPCCDDEQENEGLRSLLQIPLPADQNQCKNTDGASKVAVDQIQYTELTSTRSLIMEEKPVPCVNGREEAITFDNQEIMLSDDDSKTESLDSLDAESVTMEELSVPNFDIDAGLKQRSLNDNGFREGAFNEGRGVEEGDVTFVVLKLEGDPLKQLNEEDEYIVEKSKKGEETCAEEACEIEEGNEACGRGFVDLMLEGNNLSKESVDEEELKEEQCSDDDDEEDDGYTEDKEEKGEEADVIEGYSSLETCHTTSSEEDEDDDEDEDDSSEEDEEREEVYVEENEEESSEGTGDSSIESNAEAIWPVESMEDLPIDFKQTNLNSKTSGEKIELEDEIEKTEGSCNSDSKNSNFVNGADGSNKLTGKSSMILNKREITTQPRISLISMKPRIQMRWVFVLVLMLLLISLLTHHKAISSYFLRLDANLVPRTL